MRELALLLLMMSSSADANVSRESDRIAMGVAIESIGFTFNIKPLDESRTIEYKPNLRGVMGITGTAYGVSAAYLFQLPQSAEEEAERGKTSYDDIRLSTFVGSRNQWRIGGYYSRYSGFYIENSRDVDGTIGAGDPKIQNQDLRFTNYGVSLLHIFNSDQYSFAAATTYSDIQQRSGGSWMLRLDGDYSTFIDNQPIIPSLAQGSYGVDSGITEGRFSTLSLLGGYGHTFVKNSFFFSPQFFFGKGYQQRRYVAGGEEEASDTNADKLNLFLSLGYNQKDFYLGAFAAFDTLIYSTKSLTIESTLQTVRITGGRRF